MPDSWVQGAQFTHTMSLRKSYISWAPSDRLDLFHVLKHLIFFSWFYRMLSYKEDYGLKSIDTPYTRDNAGRVEDFMWYDGLHLPTHMQKRLARMAANIIMDVTVMP